MIKVFVWSVLICVWSSKHAVCISNGDIKRLEASSYTVMDLETNGEDDDDDGNCLFQCALKN